MISSIEPGSVTPGLGSVVAQIESEQEKGTGSAIQRSLKHRENIHARCLSPFPAGSHIAPSQKGDRHRDDEV